MKLSRRGKRTKHARRGKHTKRAGKHHTRHIKRHGKQYKRTYRKNNRKLKHNKRIQRGGYTDIVINESDQTPSSAIRITTDYTKKRTGTFKVFKNPNEVFNEPFGVTVTLTKISNFPTTHLEFSGFNQMTTIPTGAQELPSTESVSKPVVKEITFTFEIMLYRVNSNGKNVKFKVTITKEVGTGFNSGYEKKSDLLELCKYKDSAIPKVLELTSEDNTETYTFRSFDDVLFNINSQLGLDKFATNIQLANPEYIEIVKKRNDDEVQRLKNEGLYVTTKE